MFVCAIRLSCNRTKQYTHKHITVRHNKYEWKRIAHTNILQLDILRQRNSTHNYTTAGPTYVLIFTVSDCRVLVRDICYLIFTVSDCRVLVRDICYSKCHQIGKYQ
jgi:hypothetical protein